MTIRSVAIVGRGRVGESFHRALASSGSEVALVSGSQLVAGGVGPDELGPSELILITVPDQEIGAVASQLASHRGLSENAVVLHTSGLLSSSALAPLEGKVLGVGSFHPLMTFADVGSSPASLAGAPVTAEGDTVAMDRARGLAQLLEMGPMSLIPPEGKPAYHAAAVFASNFMVVLAQLADRLARESGLEHSAERFVPIMEQTLKNIAAAGPAAALTGPVTRGDVETVQKHLDVLEGNQRLLYRRLTLAAIDLADLDSETRSRLRQLMLAGVEGDTR